jgi:hypothetical protein
MLGSVNKMAVRPILLEYRPDHKVLFHFFLFVCLLCIMLPHIPEHSYFSY